MFLLCIALLLGPTFETRVQAYVSVRDASPTLVEGAIFTRESREIFRAAVRDLLTLHDLDRLQLETSCTAAARVNAALPRGVNHYVPGRLLLRFPRLPAPVEYRIVNADLVLWDVDADVVIDVLRDLFVVPSHASLGGMRDFSLSASRRFIMAEGVKATFTNGVLDVSVPLPARADAEARKVEIQEAGAPPAKAA